jgi:hypothetical protein
MFWQTKHRRRTLNPPVAPEAQALAAAAGEPDDPRAGEALRQAGIDYAVVHTQLPPPTTDPYQPIFPEDDMPRDAGSINPWLAVVERTPDAVVYRVLQKPRASEQALVRAGRGFGGLEHEGKFGARWLEQETGELAVFVTGKRRRVTIELAMSSFARPRLVTLTLAGRRVDFFVVLPAKYTTRRVDLGPLAPGRHVVDLSSKPGVQSIQEVTGIPDTRSVSIRLRDPVRVVNTPR